MNTENLISADQVLDVRALDCSVKHPMLVKTFIELPPGKYFVIRNGHEPVRLRDQFAAQWPGTFTWERLPAEPGEFCIKVTKLQTLGAPTRPIATECHGH
jgi:uncharacterized protein (DUF2249 family)